MFSSLIFCAPGLAAPPAPAIQYVGSIAINPSHDTKVVADWYQKFGVGLKAFGDGGYYGTFQTSAGPFYFGVHPRRADAPKASSSSIEVVFHVNDYNGYVSMLEKQGLKAQSVEADPSMGHFAHYRDPDGNQMTVWGD
jgi:predicted enzyme related to lactoylglutathione lyase